MANDWRKNRVSAEHISTLPDHSGRVFRLAVPGGWIVVGSCLYVDDRGNGSSMAMAFVSDEGHAWLGEGDGNE